MMKKLLSASLFAFVALSASAYNVGDFVYTKIAKYKITGENLVVNGQFKNGTTGTEGWTATDATLPLETTFTMGVDGPNGSNTQKVLAGQTALTNGMYQQVAITQGGTYVVSFKVMGSTAGFTDLDLTGGNTNYMNAYYNTDGTLGTVDGTNLLYGENGVNGGYQFSYGADGFTEISFAVEAPAEGNIMIDFRGMAEGLEIADVTCHLAENVYDDRIARDRIAYLNKYLVSEGIDEREFYDDFLGAVIDVESDLEDGASPEQMAIVMESLEGVWSEFVTANFENVLDFIPTKDGSAATGNNSANWMYWTAKWNKLSNDYKNQAPWTWSTDRWCHKTAAADSPMAIQWMRGAGANSNWNNIATLTATLSPGTYYWGVTGQGGMMTLNKNRWARSWADECAETKLFFNGDTILVDTLNAARNEDYVVEFKLEEKKEITLGIICNNVSTSENAGFDVQFYSPVLYKLVIEGELTEQQKAYLAAVETQLEALKGRIDVANEYLAETQVLLPWGKEALKEGVIEAQARYDAWAALTQDDILAMLDNYETLGDTIMNNGVRFLNNNYINPFIAMNKPLTDMPDAIEAATATKGQRIYSSSAKMDDLAAKIAESQALYDAKLVAPFSSEDSLALVNQKLDLEAMVEAFKLAIDATVLVDIDFGTQDAPATFNTIEYTDTTGAPNYYYTIAGAKGLMTFTDIEGSYPYALGWGSTTDESTGALILTDSLGMLRVGNSEAVVEIEGAPAKETDIVNIQFDFYAGKLSGKKAGYKVLSAEGDTICGLFFSSYTGDDELNTFGVDYNGKIPGVGSSSASNSAIAAESNKTAFDIVLDYGAKTMYCTTSSSKGTVTTEVIALPEVAPKQFILYSNYNNADRRCWFDNLIIQNIAAGPVEQGIENVESVKVFDNAMYNLQGQRILAPVKGQIYIQNGKKMLAK